VTNRKLAAPRLMEVIINALKHSDDYFTSTSLRPHANELMHHKPREAAALLAELNRFSAWQLGKALETIAIEDVDFCGYHLVRIAKEKNKTLWQIQKRVRADTLP
jgi:hypothetical protein